jgi:hypothetical protein
MHSGRQGAQAGGAATRLTPLGQRVVRAPGLWKIVPLHNACPQSGNRHVTPHHREKVYSRRPMLFVSSFNDEPIHLDSNPRCRAFQALGEIQGF